MRDQITFSFNAASGLVLSGVLWFIWHVTLMPLYDFLVNIAFTILVMLTWLELCTWILLDFNIWAVLIVGEAWIMFEYEPYNVDLLCEIPQEVFWSWLLIIKFMQVHACVCVCVCVLYIVCPFQMIFCFFRFFDHSTMDKIHSWTFSFMAGVKNDLLYMALFCCQLTFTDSLQFI